MSGEQIKPGYKRTEVGVIPEDWDIKEIGGLSPFVTSGSRGWAKHYSDRGSAFLRITNLSRKSIYIDLSDLKLVELPAEDSEGLRTQLQDGDLLVSITADIGIIGYVDPTVPKPAYINQHIALIRLDSTKTDSKFLCYYLASDVPQRAYKATSDQGAKAGMNLGGVRKIKAVFPALSEQRAIATTLSDMDTLLAQLDQLIAKKRDLKQAAMQQLLTGQTRLPGFSGEWEVRQLGDLCSLKSGESITATRIDEHSAYHCYGGNGLRGYTASFTHDGKYALIGRQGALCGNVLEVEGKFFASEHALVVTPKSEVAIEWLTFVLGRMNLNQYSESSAQPGLSASKLLMLRVDSPPARSEQAAIATALSHMDAELTALEARRDKTRALKQGMMQELLTGRIRLV
jgi:type I restriction enzyme S subunit